MWWLRMQVLRVCLACVVAGIIGLMSSGSYADAQRVGGLFLLVLGAGGVWWLVQRWWGAGS